jgi:Ca-activated chloride channel family protein
MYLGVNDARRASLDNRALLVLSDGGDNNSRYSESELRNMVRETDVRIFSVSVGGKSASVERIAEESGGRTFYAHKAADLPDLAASISALMHSHYVVEFSPALTARDGKYHSIRIEVAGGSGLHASWRHGYYAPLQ